MAYPLIVILFASHTVTIEGGVWTWYYSLTTSALAVDILFLANYLIVRIPPPLRAQTPFLIASLILLISGIRFGRSLVWHAHNKDIGTRMFETSEWMQENLPPDSRAYMIDHSGRIGYVSGLSVVNGDGLINNWGYWNAVHEGHLEAWLQERGIDYFVVVTDDLGAMVDESGSVVATLGIRNTPVYTLTAPTESALYSQGDQWVFPMRRDQHRVLATLIKL